MTKTTSLAPLPRTARVYFPGAEYTQAAAVRAVAKVLPSFTVLDGGSHDDDHEGRASEEKGAESDPNEETPPAALQFGDYDHLNFDVLLSHPTTSLASSYVFRKALIRKHALQHTVHAYLVKHPHRSLLRCTVPRTWRLEIQFADELDELLADDLYELAEALESKEGLPRKHFILKPSMADRGQGIRLFSTKEDLYAIFDEFGGISDTEEEEEEEDGDGRGTEYTRVATSQLRHFVIQEYISNPLLLEPEDAPSNIGDEAHATSSGRSNGTTTTTTERSTPQGHGQSKGRKFHLRAYVLAAHAIKVYLYRDMLALFAPLPYEPPGSDPVRDSRSSAGSDVNEDGGVADLRRHLTNTCLQERWSAGDEAAATSEEGVPAERNVRLFWELDGLPVYSSSPSSSPAAILTRADLEKIYASVVEVIGETFRAAVQGPSHVHFQPLPNAFEIFGVDLCVDDRLGVWLLEVNAQPDFKQTGARLSSVIDDLFESALRVGALPFFFPPERERERERERGRDDGEVVEERLTLCYEDALRRGW